MDRDFNAFIEKVLKNVSAEGLIVICLLFGVIHMMPKYQMIMAIILFTLFYEQILHYSCHYICRRR